VSARVISSSRSDTSAAPLQVISGPFIVVLSRPACFRAGRRWAGRQPWDTYRMNQRNRMITSAGQTGTALRYD
jgi:hypothetical protein